MDVLAYAKNRHRANEDISFFVAVCSDVHIQLN